MRYRMGFILPCLSFSCDGSTFEVSGEQMECENPGLRFWSAGNEVVPRDEAEAELGSFVDRVVARLGSRDVRGSEVEFCWGACWSRGRTLRRVPSARLRERWVWTPIPSRNAMPGSSSRLAMSFRMVPCLTFSLV